MLTEETLDTNEVGLNIARGPANGPPMIFLHGVLRRWNDFVPLLPSFMTRWQVAAIDFRGHGESGLTPGSYLVRDYVRDAVNVLREAVHEPAVVYGHSLGAMVAAAAAAEVPDRVSALVLEDPPFQTMGHGIAETSFLSQFSGIHGLLGREISVAQLAAELAELPIRAPGAAQATRLGDVRDAASLRFFASCLQQVDPEVLAPIIESRWLDGYDLPAIAKRLNCPTLLLQADLMAGGMLRDDDAETLLSAATDVTRIRMPQTGHLIHWTDTPGTVRIVQNFLESIR